MILSVSRRTDIPAFYSEWFYNRIKEGFVYVRNPINPHTVSNIQITPDVLDCIVFWTKNPDPMLPRLHELDQYNYYFHVTINPYGRDIECAVPKRNKVIESFKKLSDRIGPEKVIWRYNPVLFSNKIDLAYHLNYFEELAKRLSGSTGKCILSFLDNYKKTERNLNGTSVRALLKEEMNATASQLATIASSYRIELQSCAGKIDFSTEGIIPGRCIDHVLVEKITGYPIDTRKDKNQRKVCQCIESMDIGEYDSCPHYCLYCYANSDKKAVLKKSKLHDPNSPLLIGHIMEEDKITDRMCCSLRKKGLFG